MIRILLFLLFFPLLAHAQHETGTNYLRATYTQQVRKGVVRYMTFHNHNPQYNITSDYHQHLYYHPFKEAKEYTTQLALQGQYYLNPRVGVQVEIAYLLKRRDTDGETTDTQTGIGDLSIKGMYQLYNSGLFQVAATWKHVILIEGGGRIPTGKFTNFDELNELEPHLQAGTEAWAVQGGIAYLWQKKRVWEGEVSVGMRYHFPNSYTFQQGIFYNTAAYIQRNIRLGDQSLLLPSIGIQALFWESDQLNEKPIVEETKRQLVAVRFATQWRYQQWGIAASYQLPFQQSWEGIQLKQQGTLSISGTYYGKKVRGIARLK